MKIGDRKGQVTLFIIIGIILVAAAVFAYLFFPDIRTSIGLAPKNPSAFMQSCLEDSVKESAGRLSLQGGVSEPENYFAYNNEKIEYLCYSEEYYKTCVVQRPLLKTQIESEIKKDIDNDVDACVEQLKKSYESRGYNVRIGEGDFDLELLPQVIVVNFNNSITLTKEGAEQYDSLRVSVNNNLYELVSIAESIVDWETNYGDAETTTYMNYYRDLKVEKLKQSDGTTIYILTDRNTGDKFQFASRSVAWPPGYGTEGVALTSLTTLQ